MQSLIIHMTGTSKRAANVQRLLYALPNAEIADAVNGRDAMAQGMHPTTQGSHLSPSYPFPLAAGEVGCFLSHRACWQRIVDQGWDMALVVEDDLSIEPHDWLTAQKLISEHAGADDFIRLPAKRREVPAHVLAEAGQAKLFVPKVIGLQTVAQVVGRNAAKRLLAASEIIDRPVDTFLQMHWAHGQQIKTILPNGFGELTEELGGSTIQKKKRGNKLAREFKRALYRAQVSAKPQKWG